MIHSIQMLRGIAALLVVQVHLLNNLIVREVFSPNLVTNFFRVWGDFGVDIFFVISGFVMAKSLEQSHNFWNFLFRRFYRIYPLYFVSVILLLIIHFPSNFEDLSTIFLVKTFLLFPTFIQSEISMFLGPAWTLCFEVLFYFSCSLSFVFFPSSVNNRSLIVIFSMIFLSICFSSLFMTFIFGIFCWKCYKFLSNDIVTILVIVLTCSYILVVCLVDIPLHSQLNSYRWLYFGIPALITVLISTQFKFRNEFFEYVGAISFSIYLSHMALTVHVYGKFSEFIYLPFAVHFVLIIFSSVIVGVIFYEMFEKPILRRIQRYRKI